MASHLPSTVHGPPRPNSPRSSSIPIARGSLAPRDASARPAILLLTVVLGLDLAWIAFSSSTAPTEFGLVDEPAHLATALLLLVAVSATTGWRPGPAFVIAAVVAAMAIDLDHVPHHFGWDGLTAGTPRPYTHSLITAVLLLVAGELMEGRRRKIAFGAAFGVSAHLFRDLATGPGVALLWPASRTAVQMPYVAFAVGLLLATALVIYRSQSTIPAPHAGDRA